MTVVNGVDTWAMKAGVETHAESSYESSANHGIQENHWTLPATPGFSLNLEAVQFGLEAD